MFRPGRGAPRGTRAAALLAAALLCGTMPAWAEEAPPAPSAATPAATTPSPATPAQPPAVDPAALAALQRMGSYLAGLKSFDLSAATTAESVLDDGQDVEIAGTLHYQVRRPDRFRLDIRTDLMERSLYFDGRSLVVVAPQEGYFAEFAARPTITEALIEAARTAGLRLPLVALFDWGTPDAPVRLVEKALRVGASSVGGAAATHWAFRSPGYNWEVWIADGATPLPLKYAFVDLRHPNWPRFDAVLSWREVEPADAAFVFTPGPEMTRIKVRAADETVGGTP